jgi:hypothetical protein
MSDVGAVTYDDGVAVTPSDTVADPNGPFAAFATGTGGNIKVQTAKGNALVLSSCAAGIIMPMLITRVWSTGTAATGVVGLKAFMEPG